MHACMCKGIAHIHTYIHTKLTYLQQQQQQHTHIHTHIHPNSRIESCHLHGAEPSYVHVTHMYVCICVCVYVCMYVCMYTYPMYLEQPTHADPRVESCHFHGVEPSRCSYMESFNLLWSKGNCVVVGQVPANISYTYVRKYICMYMYICVCVLM